MNAQRYGLTVARSEATAQQLPESLASTVIELIAGPLVDAPPRVGIPLQRIRFGTCITAIFYMLGYRSHEHTIWIDFPWQSGHIRNSTSKPLRVADCYRYRIVKGIVVPIHL